MEREQEFDAFYRATRHGLVHLAFALTGNLSAAQKAVRAAYVAAWHHWRKVSALPDPADWVRPRALRMAQRRRTPRLRRGQRGVAGRDRAVLEAAGRLRPPQRQVLVLTEVAGLSLPAAARELGIPEETAERLLHSARATFSVSLDRDPANIHAHLQSLGETAGHASLPRPSSIRSAGRQRRQSYALLVAAAAAAVAVASGAVAYEPATVRAGRAPAEVHRVSPPAPTTGDSPAGTGRPTTAAQLLDQDQIERLGPHQRWTVERTDDNTTGDGINTFCQQSRFADPDGRAAFVRIFKADGKPRRSAVQTVEVSRSAAQARRTYDTTLGWYSGCRLARLQLLTAYRAHGIGNEAQLLLFRVWKRPVSTYTVAVARIGDATTSTVGRTVGGHPPAPRQAAQSLADSVSMLCGTTGPGDCPVTAPALARVPPPPSSEEHGVLAEVDLPPVGHVDHPWVGTKATPANRTNPAATICDNASFAGSGATRTRTRTFLIPQAHRLPDRFGLSETYGVFPSAAKARGFLDEMRGRIAKCADQHIAIHVLGGPSARPSQHMHLSTWRLRTEISRLKTVTFRVGFVRVGDSVAQLTFSPSQQAAMSATKFRDLVARAGDRLRELG